MPYKPNDIILLYVFTSSLLSIVAPLDNNISTIIKWPFSAALCSGYLPNYNNNTISKINYNSSMMHDAYVTDKMIKWCE